MPDHPTAPTEVTQETTWFDRAADRTTHVVAKPVFFLTSLGVVTVWALSGGRIPLALSVMQNESWRGSKATQRKLNAMAAALAELMARSDVDQEHVDQLNAAVGLEKRESSTR